MKKQLIELEKIIKWSPAINDLYKNYIGKTRYNMDEKIFAKYIKPLANSHHKEDIYFKAILINACYSTMMGADLIEQVAEYLQTKQNIIKKILDKGMKDKFIIEIDKFFNPASEQILTNTRKYKPYSFLTKYISIHAQLLGKDKKEDSLPIYDGYIDLILKNAKLDFLDLDLLKGTPKIKGNKLQEYSKFYNVMNSLLNKFREYHPEETISFSDVDHVLWIIGKSLFKTPHPKATIREKIIRTINKTTHKKDFLELISNGLK